MMKQLNIFACAAATLIAVSSAQSTFAAAGITQEPVFTEKWDYDGGGCKGRQSSGNCIPDTQQPPRDTPQIPQRDVTQGGAGGGGQGTGGGRR